MAVTRLTRLCRPKPMADWSTCTFMSGHPASRHRQALLRDPPGVLRGKGNEWDPGRHARAQAGIAKYPPGVVHPARVAEALPVSRDGPDDAAARARTVSGAYNLYPVTFPWV